MPGDTAFPRPAPARTQPRWRLLALTTCAAACATAADRPPDDSARPLCAQPFSDGQCLEGTWPATWRDGRWDCRIVQDQLALDGIPADRCASFASADEVAERLRTLNSRRSGARATPR